MCKKAVTLPSKSNYIQMSPLELKKKLRPNRYLKKVVTGIR